MKYLGKITDNKDLVTKEYVDTAVETKQDKLTAGANITITDDGTISSSGGGTGESDVFVLELEIDSSGNVTSASHTFEETKAAIESHKVIMIDKTIAIVSTITDNDNTIKFILEQSPLFFALKWISNVEGLGTAQKDLYINLCTTYPPSLSEGYLFLSESNGLETKQIPTYTAGEGISISSNNVISVVAPKVYAGADAPADTLGSNGDIYIQISEA